MDNFFVSEFQYTEECIPEYLKRWWRENLIVSYILTALVFLYFFLMLIIRRNLVYLFLELLPILLLLLIRVKVSRAIKIEKEKIESSKFTQNNLDWIKKFKHQKKFTDINRSIINEFIDNIYVGDKDAVEISFLHKDQYEDALKYLKSKNNMV